jgi:ubiquinone/menaquinone biosynthesis C-methylase UbiE
MGKETVREHFEGIAGEYDRWKKRSSYYYSLLSDIYREFVPPGADVLEVGCGTGTLLRSLRPRRGVGIDISPRMIEIASSKFPELTFAVADAENLVLEETFDYIIVPDVIEHLMDVAAMLRAVRRRCRPGGTAIVTCVNPLWAPALHLAERLGLKMPEGGHRWLPAGEIESLARKAGFSVAGSHGRILCPKRVPLLAAPLNRLAGRLGFLRPLCLTQVIVLKPRGEPPDPVGSTSADK